MTESRTWPKPGWIFFLVAALIFSLDVFTKHLVLEHLLPGQRIEVIPGFLNWTYVTNDGIAFGLFQGNNLLLGIIAAAILLFGFWISRDLDWRSLEVNLVGGLIVAGAIGNLVDRIRHGHVIDFVDVYVNEWHWPSFNVADSAISVSMAWIILRIVADSFRGQDPSRAKS
jgi:signal peptidase II